MARDGADPGGSPPSAARTAPRRQPAPRRRRADEAGGPGVAPTGSLQACEKRLLTCVPPAALDIPPTPRSAVAAPGFPSGRGPAASAAGAAGPAVVWHGGVGVKPRALVAELGQLWGREAVDENWRSLRTPGTASEGCGDGDWGGCRGNWRALDTLRTPLTASSGNSRPSFSRHPFAEARARRRPQSQHLGCIVRELLGKAPAVAVQTSPFWQGGRNGNWGACGKKTGDLAARDARPASFPGLLTVRGGDQGGLPPAGAAVPSAARGRAGGVYRRGAQQQQG
eukprot:gene17416-biopygen7660